MLRPIVVVSVVFALARFASLAVVSQPGYTDAYYYATVASRLARGDGLTADFVWSFMEAPGLAPLPVPSNRFFMPLASVAQAIGIALLGPLHSFLGDFRAGQLALALVACALPALAYALARSLGATERASLAAAAVVGAGGVLAPAWVTADGFALAAVLGSAFFLCYRQAASGSVASGVAVGLAAGLLFLARAEAALFGIALLALARRPASRGPGLAGSAVALAIGLAWLARDLTLQPATSLVGRSALLVRYDDLFALASPDPLRFLLADPALLAGQRLEALAANAATAASLLLLALAPPLVVGIRALWPRPEVPAFVLVALLVYLVESLVFPLHSTRGSYAHSLAAFFPMAIAIAAAGAEVLISSRGLRVALPAVVALYVAVGAQALVQWDASFNAAYRERVAALSLIPPGPFLAVDAAAWRWIAGRAVLVTPSEGAAAAACVGAAYGARAVVLEPAHFAAYDALYAGGPGVRVLPLDPRDARCGSAAP